MNYPHTSEAASRLPPSRRGSRCCTGLLVALLLVALQGGFVAAGAEPLVETPQVAAGKPAPKTYTLRVTKEGTTNVSLTAEGANVSEIAADLSKRLNAPVIVGPTMQKETISAKFSELPLEQALSSIAPRVYVDYEIRQNAQPVPLAIYLVGFVDPEPALNAVVRGNSQGVLITGNTEDTGKSSPDDPLLVVYEKKRLTIVSKKQPLSIVVMAVADVLGVPAEIKYEAAETVDTNIKGALVAEDAILGLSPNVRLDVRVDVNRGERTLLQLVVKPAAAK